MLSFTLWTEKITEKGEDAPPTLLIDEEVGTGILAVYDGLGGAGSTPYQIGNKSFSGAYLASRLAMQVAEQTFVTKHYCFIERNPIHEEMRKDYFSGFLEKYLKTAFQLKIAQLDQQRSKIRSKLIKRLPTTIAGLTFSIDEGETMAENTYYTESFWAGDSRVYVWLPSGLKQISEDNLTEKLDAQENLEQDAPISNCISADDDFEIFSKRLTFQQPIVLITATDGTFGYLPTPAHFEYYLLATLHHPHTCTTEDWKNILTLALEYVTGDDMSLCLLTLGYKNLEHLKFASIGRLMELKNEFIFAQKDKSQIWQNYKKGYYELMNSEQSGIR
jgi:serine/threonine protein phosphatase PrpC